MKFDFHLKSGKTVTIDFPDMNAVSEFLTQDNKTQVVGVDGIVFIEDTEAITVHVEPAEPRTLIDGDGDVWTEESLKQVPR